VTVYSLGEYRRFRGQAAIFFTCPERRHLSLDEPSAASRQALGWTAFAHRPDWSGVTEDRLLAVDVAETVQELCKSMPSDGSLSPPLRSSFRSISRCKPW